MSKAVQCPLKSILPFFHSYSSFIRDYVSPVSLQVGVARYLSSQWNERGKVPLPHLGLKTWHTLSTLLTGSHWLELSSDCADDNHTFGNNGATR